MHAARAFTIAAIAVGIIGLALAPGGRGTPNAGVAAGNGKIAFASAQGVALVEPDGRDLRLLVAGQPCPPPTGPICAQTGPQSWSPDGSQLAVVRDFALHVVDAAGTHDRAIPTGVHVASALWSPDGERIAFQSFAAGNSDLFVVRADGTGLQRLTFDGRVASPPSWSPDGTKLVYSDGQLRVIAFGRDGSVTGRWSGPAGVSPEWAPLGTLIAFVRGDPGSMNGRLYVVDAAGDEERKVSDLPLPYLPRPFARPSWSPDGSRLAFVSVAHRRFVPINRLVGTDIYVVDSDGGRATRLTATAERLAEVGDPRWSPDGTKIAFHAWRNAEEPRPPHVFTMNADGTCERRLTDREAANPTWQPVPGRPPSARTRCVDAAVVSQASEGPQAPFAFSVVNEGTEALMGVRVVLRGDRPMSVLLATTSRGSCSRAPRPLTCTIGRLAPGDAVEIAIRAIPAVVGELVIDAQATVAAFDANDENDAAEARRVFSSCSTAASGGGTIRGTQRDDQICGRSGRDRIHGLGGNDDVDGGRGKDVLLGGPGGDRLFARDGSRDVVSCGPGSDRALVDMRDAATGCERVSRR